MKVNTLWAAALAVLPLVSAVPADNKKKKTKTPKPEPVFSDKTTHYWEMSTDYETYATVGKNNARHRCGQ